MKTFILLSALLLSGCLASTEEVRRTPVIVPERGHINVPPEDLRTCQDLPRFEDRLYTDADLVVHLRKWIDVHESCACKANRLANVVISSFNLGDEVLDQRCVDAPSTDSSTNSALEVKSTP